MARKTPKLVHELLAKYEQRRDFFEEEIRLCKEVNEPTSLLVARAEQSSIIMEEILHVANCYHGFQFLDEFGSITLDPQKQLHRRVMFYVK